MLYCCRVAEGGDLIAPATERNTERDHDGTAVVQVPDFFHQCSPTRLHGLEAEAVQSYPVRTRTNALAFKYFR
ncbi:hypothetical protein A4X20_16315 [Mycolicibacterium iranicum]|uniref:Uncharacterized protein n=1 Tax=Mycolicibacterium iranicum TaxID=912594 RepID=A0A178M115_MYCIR|nr:hypothetical protein A4X20_16315 [Mycolicibacterium iranicum]